MENMKKMRKCLIHFLEFLAAFLLVTLTIVVILGVIDRFILHMSFAWPEELGRFLLIWTSLICAAVTAGNKNHFIVDIIVNKFKKNWHLYTIWTIIINLISALIVLITIFKSIPLVQLGSISTAPSMGIHMSLVYVSIPISFTFILIFIIIDIIDAAMNYNRKEVF